MTTSSTPSPGDWEGVRVLVTGHTGFKGGWLCLWLKSLGAEVCGYALSPPTDPSLFELAGIGEEIDSRTGDVRDLSHLEKVVRTFDPEVIFHLAAQPIVHRGHVEPVETYSTNMMGTVNVLEVARHAGTLRAVVIVTSDKCYENTGSRRGYVESDPMGGYDPYSSSKGCAELVTAAYRRSYFEQGATASMASARAGNVIGGGDWAESRLIPDIVRARLSGSSVHIRHPNAVRPWQHVLEALNGYLLLADRLRLHGDRFGGPWNFGPNEEDERPVGWVLERFSEGWPGGLGWEHDAGSHPHEAAYLSLDSGKARDHLGWRPMLPLQEALAWTAEWYSAYEQGRDLRGVTLQQIQRYVTRAAIRGSAMTEGVR